MRKASIVILTVMSLLVLSSCASNNTPAVLSSAEVLGTSIPVPESISSSTKKEVRMFADYPYYSSLDELIKKSHYIVYGEVLSKSCEMRSITVPDESMSTEADALKRHADDKTMVTTYEIRVLSSADDMAKKDQILYLLETGGEDEDTIYIVEGAPEIKLNEKYLFFTSKSALVENGGWLMNHDQALYLLTGDDAQAAAEGNFEKVFERIKKAF